MNKTVVTPEFIQILPNLRFVKKEIPLTPTTATMKTVLQQAYRNMTTGKITWKDVPLVEVTDE